MSIEHPASGGTPPSLAREESGKQRPRPLPIVVLVVLGALVALGPLSTDAYVPGLPRLANDLHASASAAQLSVTTCLIGLATGQLVAGPLSDALGRRRPLLAGVAVYAGAGIFCAIAPDVAVLDLLRGLQGLGGAFALVVAYAYVRDSAAGPAAARTFSALLLVTGLAPVLAPLAGGGLLAIVGWRGIFVALAVLSATVLVASAAALPESLPPSRRAVGGSRSAASVYAHLLRDRALLGYALVNALVFAAMFVYISGSPFVLQHLFGLSPQQYALVFAVNAVGLVAAAQVSGRLVERLLPQALLTAGVIGACVGGVALLLATGAGAGLWPTLTALFVVVSSVGLVLPNAAALALDQHGANAGSASAILGCGQFLLGGLLAPLAGVGGAGTALPMSGVIAALTVAAVLTLLAVFHAPRRAAGR